MTFRLMVMNPAFPKDKEKAVALTVAQLAQVNSYLVSCMNAGRKINEAKVIEICAESGYPIEFESEVGDVG